MPTDIAKTRRFSQGHSLVRLAIGIVALGALTAATGASNQQVTNFAEAPSVTPSDADTGNATALLVPKHIRLIIGYRKTRTA